MEILSCSLLVCRALSAQWRSVGAVAPERVVASFLWFSPCVVQVRTSVEHVHLDSCDRTQAVSFKHSQIHCTIFNMVKKWPRSENVTKQQIFSTFARHNRNATAVFPVHKCLETCLETWTCETTLFHSDTDSVSQPNGLMCVRGDAQQDWDGPKGTGCEVSFAILHPCLGLCNYSRPTIGTSTRWDTSFSV